MSLLDDEQILVDRVISKDIIIPIISNIESGKTISKEDKCILEKYIGIYKFKDSMEFGEFIKNVSQNISCVDLSLNWIDTSNITNMKNLFYYSYFNGDISKWDVSNVEDMSYMFYNSKFNSDISKWDVSNVENMKSIFRGSNFNGDISKWDVSNVKDMESMFYNSLFNGDISKWNVSNVVNMSYMFYGSEFNRDISKWDVSNVEDMVSMFAYSQFNGDISKWDVSKVKSVNNMFENSNFDGNISKWRFSEILDEEYELTDYNILKSKHISYENSLLREKLNFENGYDVIKLSGKYILEKLLNVNCSDNRSIISNVCKIKSMIDIINSCILLINVKETARLYSIPEKFIVHVNLEQDNFIDFQLTTDLYNVFS